MPKKSQVLGEPQAQSCIDRNGLTCRSPPEASSARDIALQRSKRESKIPTEDLIPKNIRNWIELPDSLISAEMSDDCVSIVCFSCESSRLIPSGQAPSPWCGIVGFLCFTSNFTFHPWK